MNSHIYFNSILKNEVNFFSYKLTNEFFNNKIEQFKIHGPLTFVENLPDFALVFVQNNKIHLLRDHFGNTPLFYLILKNKLYYSTDIINLINLPDYNKSINLHELNNFLSITQETTYSNQTLWKGIYSVLPGNILIFDSKDSFQYISLFNLVLNKANKSPFDNFYSTFKNSIEKRISKNKNLASSLSGGIDSSSITSITQKISSKKIDTIELRTVFEIGKERSYAQDVVDKWKTNHTILSKYPNYFKSEKKNCEISGLPSYSLITASRLESIIEVLNKKNDTIFLMGEGGDEVLGLQNEYLNELIEKRNFKELRKTIISLLNTYKIPYIDLYKNPYFSSFFKVTLKNLLKNKRVVDLFNFSITNLNITFFYELTKKSILKIFKESIPNATLNYEAIIKYKNNTRNKSTLIISDFANFGENKNYLEIIFSDHPIKLREQYFAMGKNRNIEFIYPFLDMEIINLIASTEKKINFGNGIGRNIIRQAMVGTLPDSIIKRNSKTSFSPFLNQVFWDLYEEAEKKFPSDHSLWNYLDFSIYNKILTVVKNTNYYDINNYGLKNFYLILLIKIYYFGIWLDVYFKD